MVLDEALERVMDASTPLFDAIKGLFHDPGFSTSSKAAEEAKATASMLLSLCNHESPEVFSLFSCTLVANLRSCVSSAPGSAIKKQKEAMWSSYHALRCTQIAAAKSPY